MATLYTQQENNVAKTWLLVGLFFAVVIGIGYYFSYLYNNSAILVVAVIFSLVMNFSYFLAGTVSHNPRDIFLGFIIITAGYNAGRIGLDRWVVPFFTKMSKKDTEREKAKVTA